MKGYIVVWNAYGEWKSTTKIFTSAKEAKIHIDKYLTSDGKDYNKNCQIIKIEFNA